MKKAIIIVRTSTVRQEIDSQRTEVIDYAISDGYALDELEIIGDVGSSAIKLDARYMENINRVFNTIKTTPSIECVYTWAIDRIGRREDLLMNFKQFLIERKINLKVMNPSVSLLKADGTVDSGMELAFSLFATMAKQEMEQKKERFRRAKTRNHKEGRFNGGEETRFGYSVNENGYFVVNQEEAEIVRVVFEEYATGNYSMQKLATELNERGLEHRKRLFSVPFIHHLLKDNTYIGAGNKQAIIEKELFDKAAAVRKKQASPLLTKEVRHIHLAVKLLKCKECGTNYISHYDRYTCYKHRFPKRFTDTCRNNLTIRTNILDPLLWKVALDLHKQYLSVPDEARIEELDRELAILGQKMFENLKRIEGLQDRKKRVIDVYTDGVISKEEYKKKLDKIRVDLNYYNEQTDVYNQQAEHYKALAEKVKNPEKYVELNITDPIKQKEIVVKHIKNIAIERYLFEGKEMVKIYINNLEFIYNPTSKVKSQMNLYDVQKGKWICRV